MSTPGVRTQAGRVTLIGVGCGLLTFLAGIRYWCEHPLAAVVSFLACAGYAAAGALLATGSGGSARADSRLRTGRLLLVGAFGWTIAWLVAWNTGIAPMFSFYGQAVFFIPTGIAILSYPAGRLTGLAERAWVVFAALVLAGGQLWVQLSSRPEWNGLASDVVWPNRAGSHATFALAIASVGAGQIMLALWYLVLLWRRGRRLTGLDRRAVLPVLATAGLVGCASAAFTSSQTSAWTNLATLESLYFAEGTIALLVPIAVLSGALRDRWRELSASNRVVRMTSSLASVPIVRAALATALRDPTLVLLFWVRSEESYVDQNGQSHSSEEPPGRWRIDVRDDAQERLAIVEVDTAFRQRPDIVDAVLRAGAQALLTAQLQAAATTHLKQILAAQARLEEKELAERRRLEQDLHDGAQRRLAALLDELATVAVTSSNRLVRAVAAECREEVAATIAELHALASGLHPTVLRSNGLGPALDEVAERLGLEVELAVCDVRHPPAVEATAYFAFCEALTNVAKHAPDALVRIEVTESDGWLHGTVADNGPGGARLVPGGGLAGIEDRTRALHGWAALESSAGAGTRLRVALPCA